MTICVTASLAENSLAYTTGNAIETDQMQTA